MKHLKRNNNVTLYRHISMTYTTCYLLYPDNFYNFTNIQNYWVIKLTEPKPGLIVLFRLHFIFTDL